MNSVLEQNLRSLQQLKLEVSKDELENLLETRRVALVLTDDSPAHAITLRTATNILSRLSFYVGIAGSNVGVEQTLEEARRFGFAKVHCADREKYNLTIAIGDGPLEADLFAYVSGWNICLTTGHRRDTDADSSNAVCGAMLGAIISSESLNRTIGSVLGKTEFQDRICISLLDYSSNEARIPAGLPAVHIPDVTLVGCGAVGNALIYALAAVPRLTGRINIVDPDWFTKTNSHRYMLSSLTENETSRVYKTIRAKEFLGHHKELKVLGYEKDFEEFLGQGTEDRRVAFLISAVDSHAKRREIGRQTPQKVLNASTGHFTLAVSTHYDAYSGAQTPCVGCIYPPGDAEQARYTLIAQETGLRFSEVQALDNVNGKMTKELLSAISSFRSERFERYSEFEGQPFDSFYQHGICGGTQVLTTTGQADIPLAPISAVAGILLANELVKQVSPSLSQYSLDNFLQLDMLNLSSQWFLQRITARYDCDCQRSTYRRRFSRKYQRAPGGYSPMDQLQKSL